MCPSSSRPATGGRPTLSEAQKEYAASDVLYLHKLKAALEAILTREGRMEVAQRCFDFLPTRAELDLLGWDEPMTSSIHDR
jgi:ribonuclease D